jgi:MFS family permease
MCKRHLFGEYSMCINKLIWSIMLLDGVELMIIIIGTFAQALSGDGHAVSIIGVLIVWRFITGIGIGGDYPLSAVISSEFASTRTRGRMMAAVFAAQGWGNFSTLNQPLNAIIFENILSSRFIGGNDHRCCL